MGGVPGGGETIRKTGDVYEGGPFLKGKLHGSGTLKHANGDWSSGRFVHGILQGQGEEFIKEFGVRYKGGFIDGYRFGKGILIAEDGSTYNVVSKDGMSTLAVPSGGCTVSGQGWAVCNDGSHYHGSARHGQFHGWGVLVSPDGTRYEGYWRDGKRHGQGIMTILTSKLPEGCNAVICYEGEFTNDHPTGEGTLTWLDGSTYTGDVVDAVPSGKGTKTFGTEKPHLHTFTGMYQKGVARGKGELTWRNGGIYKGDFRDGMMHGRGELKTQGHHYSGQYEKNYIQHGMWTLPGGDFTYVGPFGKDGRPLGEGEVNLSNGAQFKGVFKPNVALPTHGQYTYADGRVYVGDFLEGTFFRHGHGEMRFEDGTVCKCNYKNDTPEPFGTINYPTGVTYTGSMLGGAAHGEGQLTFEGKAVTVFCSYDHGCLAAIAKIVLDDGRVISDTNEMDKLLVASHLWDLINQHKHSK